MSGINRLFQFVRMVQQSMKFSGKRRRRIIIADTKIHNALLNSALNVMLSADAIMMFMNQNDRTYYITAIMQARYGRIRRRQIGDDSGRLRLGGLGRHVLDILETS